MKHRPATILPTTIPIKAPLSLSLSFDIFIVVIVEGTSRDRVGILDGEIVPVLMDGTIVGEVVRTPLGLAGGSSVDGTIIGAEEEGLSLAGVVVMQFLPGKVKK